MPEIEITINTETGESSTEIKGIIGAGCEKVAEQLKNYLGEPTRDEKTPEYFAVPQVKRQIKGK